MWNRTVVTVVAGAALLAGCHAKPGPSADIAKITDLKSSFGKQFSVNEVPKTGIDPKFLAGQKLPEGLKFQPPNCAEFAAGQLVPTGTEGNMAAVSAEGEGNRFIVIAVETNTPVPVVEPGKDCSKVAFESGMVRGTVEAVEVPKIDGTTTIGVHRVVQTTVNGKPRTGEVFNYSAHFGDYQVIVSANPLVLPNKPTVPVNTQRARDLLIAGVNAIRK
jgi:hypothetical protein